MGGALQVRQGLAIKTTDVVYTPAMSKNKWNPKPLKHGRLVRTSEVRIVGDPGVPAAGSQMMRQFGLKISMRFRNAHRNIKVEWTAGDVQVGPGPYTRATRSQAVTTLCEDIFGTAAQWWGFKIKGSDITPPWPLTYPVDRDRLFFRVTVDKFAPHHPKDFHEVPAVVVLDNLPDFTQHYALGMAIFTVGKNNNSLQFDTEVVAYN